MRLTRLFLIPVLAAASLAAHADPITYTFSFNGAGANNGNSGSTISGTTMIDTSAGAVENIILNFSPGGTVSGVFSQPDATKVLVGPLGDYRFQFTNLVNLFDPNQISQATFTLTTPDDQTFDGHITGAVNTIAATPEPSSLILLGTGLLGFAGVLRKRNV